MASLLIRRALDFTDRPNFDGLGVFFIIFLALYTLVVAAGLIAIFFRRKTAAIRVRGWKLTSLSIILNHVYLATVICIYPENGAFKCGGEFWVMGWFSSPDLLETCLSNSFGRRRLPPGLGILPRYVLEKASSGLPMLTIASCQHAFACIFHPPALPGSWKSRRNHEH